jgi:chaperonin cofactor prefoldin
VNTGLFNHHLVPSKEYSTRVKEAYGNIYRSKIDFRTQLVDDEYALFRERREILESPYYGRLMNYYSTNTLYQSIHSILRNGLLDYEKFEDIIDGRIKLDEDYTNAGGLWYITSYEFADSNIRRLRYNIDKFELLRESVMQLYVSGSNLGLNPYIPMTTHTKKTNLDNKAATLKARVTTYNKRLEALDSSNSRVNSELYKLRERLKIETDSARKASLMFSIVDQKTIRSRNNADKRRIREKIDTLYDQIAKTTDKLDVILTQIRDTQGTYEQEYKDFLYHLDVMIESLYARQALMHDVYYNLTSNDHQFDELSKLLLSGADFTSTYALAGASTNDFLTRAYYYISGDLGMTGIYLRNEVSIVRPYVGVNFNLFPINKHAHYNVFNARNWYRGTSVMIGAVLDFNSNDFDYYRNSLSTQTAFMTGVGCRLSDYIRLSAGAVWLQEKQSLNPLLSDYRLTPAPFVSLSLDVDVRKHVSSVTTRLSTSNLF